MTTDVGGAGATPAPLLEMRGITKRFGGVAALSGVDLGIHPGEIVALLGENGAGKSTLMKILGGVQPPDEGEIRVDGRAVTIRSVGEADKLGIAFIHQELNVLDNLDVAANVYLGREPTRGGPLRLLDRAAMERDTATYLKQIGLDVAATLPVSRLSLAQRQLVEIARALAQNARLIIMDEPTSSLTLTETDRLLSVMRDLRDRGVAIIYISHRLGEIQAVADRVVGLRDGRNAGALTRDEINRDAMVRLMVGRDLKRVMEEGTPNAERDNLPPRLQVRNLETARYPGKPSTFSIQPGEILGFAGLVGAGRSEIAQALFGVEPALAGEICLDGQAWQPAPAQPQTAITQGIYLIPEDRRRSGLIISLPIDDNITLPSLGRLAPGGLIQRGKERDIAREAATQLNVKAASLTLPAGALSGGNQQKVVLAKWLTLAPRVLIFDEPTRGIDVGAKAEIYELIRGLATRGVAVILISSDMEEVLSMSDRVAVMHEGRITGILPRAAAREETVMNLAVGGTPAA